MAPVEVQYYEQPISRTYQYRKVMKPLLERKRRARINRCLDELKELMVGALQTEGENVAKMEKADVLELTVRHLHKLKRQQLLSGNPMRELDRFRSGFTHCANEISRCLATIPGVDIHLGTKLMTHLGHTLNHLSTDEAPQKKAVPLTVHVPQQMCSPPDSPQSSVSSNLTLRTTLTPVSVISSGYCSGCESCPSPCGSTTRAMPGLLQIASPTLTSSSAQDLWRPW